MGWNNNHSILMLLIRFTIRIQEFLTELFPLRDRGNCGNFAQSPALAKVCSLCVSRNALDKCTILTYFYFIEQPRARQLVASVFKASATSRAHFGANVWYLPPKHTRSESFTIDKRMIITKACWLIISSASLTILYTDECSSLCLCIMNFFKTVKIGHDEK